MPTRSPSTWPSHLDALIAAPRHHALLLENDRVRVLDTRIPRGETVPVHTHRWPCVLHILSWSDFVRRDADGNITADSRGKAPPARILWLEALGPHSLENVGTAEFHAVSVELKGDAFTLPPSP